MSFDVMRDPWIGCVDSIGKPALRGIRELLLGAHMLTAVQDSSPLQEYGIYRLLTVVVMDMCRPYDSTDMEVLLGKGRFNEAQVDAYIADCERDGPCFDLFDEKRPFMQDAFNPRYDGEKNIKPVSTLLHDLPSGNNHIHFDHRRADAHRLTYAECARALCAVNVFCTAGTQGPSSINGAPPYYVIIDGKDLYQSLILNCIHETAISMSRYAKPGPVWRTPNTRAPSEEIASVSLLEGMTLQARRICLIDDQNGYVSRMYFQKGVKFVGYSVWRDPHTIVSQNNSSMKPSLEKDLWRNVATLFANGRSAPLTVSQSAALIDDAENLSVTVYSLVTRQAALDAWLRDTLSIPVPMLNVRWMMDELGGYIGTAENVGSILYKTMRKICFETKIAASEIERQSVQQYYASVRAYLFSKQLHKLSRSKPTQIDELRLEWMCTIRSAASKAFVQGSERMGDSAGVLAAVAKAELFLHKALGSLNKTQIKEEA